MKLVIVVDRWKQPYGMQRYNETIFLNMILNPGSKPGKPIASRRPLAR
jgi:hypothetical protein